MRLAALIPLLAVAACSEAPAPKEAEAPAAAAMQAGQWELTHEVASLTQRDKGAPALDAPQGSKTTTSRCLSEADAKKPQAAFFAPDGFECSYRDNYFSGGRVNATLACTRDGLRGDIGLVVNGSSTADTLEATVITETQLVSDGDVRIETKLTGKRTAPACTPAAPAKA